MAEPTTARPARRPVLQHERRAGEEIRRGERLVRAAGAVLWRPAAPEGAPAAGAVEVALVHRPRYDDWSFPKGKVKGSEHLLQTVRREVAEETGARARLGVRLPSAHYLKDGSPKQVDYWAARVVDEGRFVPGDEVDELRWTSVPEALGLLSYARDAELLRTFAELPRTTRPVIVLRHACAGEKRFWHGEDLLRPLDPRGRWESSRLVSLLAGYAPGTLVSSAAQRCVESLLPYAVAASHRVTTDPAFTVGAPVPAAPVPRLRALLDAPHDGLLICTHGELVPELVGELCSRFDAPQPEDPALRKGAFWVFHTTDDAIVSLEHHAVPSR